VLSDADAARYTPSAVLSGWTPLLGQSGTP
jgi:hypothetical protein